MASVAEKREVMAHGLKLAAYDYERAQQQEHSDPVRKQQLGRKATIAREMLKGM